MTPASSGVDPSLHALKVAYITDHAACAEGVLKIPYYTMAEPVYKGCSAIYIHSAIQAMCVILHCYVCDTKCILALT